MHQYAPTENIKNTFTQVLRLDKNNFYCFIKGIVKVKCSDFLKITNMLHSVLYCWYN